LRQLELTIQSEGKIAIATADVARGWRQLKHTFGFCEEARLEFPEELVLRVQASMHAWPNRLGFRFAQYPPHVYGLSKAGWGKCELREEKLRIEIEMPTIYGQRLPRSGLPGIYQPPVELDKKDRVGFWFSLLIVLGEKARHDYPDIFEWDTQFVMGGRPGSSRRH
jgi:hypothetical protein